MGLDQEFDSHKIDGATDGTQIGNTGDRLHTQAKVDPRPPFCVMYRSEPLLNGSSPNMNVDGSVTPVVFTIKPTVTDEEWYGVRLGLQIDDIGATGTGKFGAITGGLTNGLKIEFKINSTTETFKVLKTNEQTIMHFTEGQWSDGGHSILGANTNFFQGHFNFDGNGAPLTMHEAVADEIKVTVQDDLTGLSLLRMAFTYWKEI